MATIPQTLEEEEEEVEERERRRWSEMEWKKKMRKMKNILD
jgi:hypothetical protein